MSILIAWQSGSIIVKDSSNLEGTISFPVSTPSITTTPLPFLFYVDGDTPVVNLINVKLYLSGDPTSVNIIQNVWPNIQVSRPDLNGGLEISLDQGRTFTRFSSTVGLASDPTTWIILPASATSYSTEDGVLSSLDAAAIQLRLVIPPGATQYQKFNFEIEVDCDVR